MLVEAKFNRYGSPVRVVDTRKAAEHIVQHWADTTPDGNPESLVVIIDKTLKEILVQLCDA
jgi:hypothetical protein